MAFALFVGSICFRLLERMKHAQVLSGRDIQSMVL